MSVIPMRPGPDAHSINQSIRGFTELRHFDLTYEAPTQQFALRLTLADRSDRTRILLFRHVQNLELNPLGEQFSQLISLRVEDVRADGLDPIRFTVDELENGTLFFHCFDLELIP